MLKRFLSTLALFAFLAPWFAVFTPDAQAFSLPMPDGEEVELTDSQPIVAGVSANSTVEVNKSIIFDASSSYAQDLEAELTYEWFFGDGNRQSGVEVVHSYAYSGEYELTLVVRDTVGNQVSVLHDVFVYENSFALITNVEDEQERIAAFVDSAQEENVLIELVESYSDQSEFLQEEVLKNEIIENIGDLEVTDTIVVWTSGSSGLTVFSQVYQSISDDDFFRGKDIVFISDEDFGSLANIARGVYQTVQPERIILTRSEAVWALLDVKEEFAELLEERGIQYEIVDDRLRLRPWNVMSYFVNFMLDRGIPANTIRLVLMLPIIVTVVAFMKQVIGLATLGVYTPSILALSFIALDLEFGLVILIAILLMGTLTRLFLRRYRLLYIPRMAIVLSLVSLMILVLLLFGAALNISSIAGIAVFPMLIMSTMVEKFVSIQGEKGVRTALTLVGETVLVAILCYFVAEWEALKVIVLGHPEVIFLFLGMNIFLARWGGLRLMEYFRFREIIRHAEE
jgi:hypothetical protein